MKVICLECGNEWDVKVIDAETECPDCHARHKDIYEQHDPLKEIRDLCLEFPDMVDAEKVLAILNGGKGGEV